MARLPAIVLLPEDDEHPVRPDLPVLRHLTFTEAHALEIGVYLALFLYFGQTIGLGGEAFTVVIAAVRTVISDEKSRGTQTRCDHGVGFHDAREEPPYFGTGAVVTYVVAYALGAVVFGVMPPFPAA